MSVAIPLELKEKNPVDPGRLDFTCLCSKVDSAEQSIRDPLTGITRSTPVDTPWKGTEQVRPPL